MSVASAFFRELRSRNYYKGLVNNDILYLPKCNCIYVAVSKNACSLIKSELYKIEHRRNRPTSVSPHNRILMGFKSPADMSESKFYNLIRDNNVPKFTVARDPVSRIISCFNNRIASLGIEPYDNVDRMRKEWIMNRQKILSFCKKTPITYEQAIKYDISLNEFIDFIITEHPYEMDRHWLPQNKAMFIDMIEYSYIGNLDEMNTCLQDISKLIGADSRYKYTGSKLNRSNHVTQHTLDNSRMLSYKDKYIDDFLLYKNAKNK